MERKIALSLILAAGLIFAGNAFAQHSIDVQRLAAKGEYMEALISYEKLPKRRASTEAVSAAARSAWGLGLSQRAIQEYDKALLDEKLGPVERARIYLSRAIIEFQEERFQTAVLYADRSVGLLTDQSPLRAKALLVWGNSLTEMGLHAAAEQKYVQALEEEEIEDKAELHYRLGMVQMQLGKLDEARTNLEKVPLHHDRTPEAMRFLAQISLESKKYTEAEFWLNKGRGEYPDSFLDSWVDYVLVRVAIGANDTAKVKSLVDEAEKKYPPSDDWLNLLQAASEAFYWGNKAE
jgi:tetratricopeptide (TPR) repeat protein